MNNGLKTIFFVVATPARVNFILRTDVFRILKNKGFCLVVISPFGGDKNFVEEFGGANVVFEPLFPAGKLTDFFNNLRAEALAISHPRLEFSKKVHEIATRNYRPAPSWAGKIKKALKKAVLFFIPSVWRFSPEFWNSAEGLFYRHRRCRRLFKKYNPSAVVLASGGAEGADNPFLIYCRKFGVPSVATDGNIDVFEFRYFSVPRPVAKWTLFSDVQKREAMEVQKIPEENIAVTGAARYDYYFKDFKPLPRGEFFKKIGADPLKKLIVFGAKVPKLYPYNGEIIEAILAAISGGRLGEAQLFTRFDPGHNQEIYGDLLKRFLWEKADDFPHREHVANLLYYADAVISVNSTFCIEACLVGAPAAWIGFGGAPDDEYARLYQLTYELNLFKRILATGGIPLVKSSGELVKWLEKNLADRNLDAEKRKRLIEQEYFKTDGRSGERVAEVILNLIK